MALRPDKNLLPEPRDVPDNILVEGSIQELGVDPRRLKPSSCRKVLASCPDCSGVFEKGFRRAVTQPLCLRCSNKRNSINGASKRSEFMKRFYANGGKHPTKGIGHSEETRKKISKNRKGIKANVSEDGKKRILESCLAVLHTPEMKERLRLGAKSRTGVLSPSFGKPPAHAIKVWHVKKDGERVCFRSTWEAIFAAYLDEHSVEWQYEAQTFPVQLGDKMGSYTPDFKTEDKWYEVKGRWTNEGLAKFEAFKNQYPQENIQVIDRAWLYEHKLIKYGPSNIAS